jgi:hypothetical protein
VGAADVNDSERELRRDFAAYKVALGVCAEEVLQLREEVAQLRVDAERFRRLRRYQHDWAARKRHSACRLS